jgi:hypothetical protein
MVKSLEERLREHPALYARMDQLLNVVENARGDVEKAAEAERRLIEELRQMGQEALQGWAERRQRVLEETAEANPALQRKEKKVSTGRPASGESK